MDKETGGPAFPREDYQCNGDPGRSHGLGQEGMTLRDYFAAKAMQGILANPGQLDNVNSEAAVAKDAYTVADAMLAARNK